MKPIIKESEINDIHQKLLVHKPEQDELIHYAIMDCIGIEQRNTKGISYTDFLEVSNITNYMVIFDTINLFTRIGKSLKDIVKAFEFIGYEVIMNLTNIEH